MVDKVSTKASSMPEGDASSRLSADKKLEPRHAKTGVKAGVNAGAAKASQKKGLARGLTALIVILVVVAVCAGAFYIWQTVSMQNAVSEDQSVETPLTPADLSETELPDNPIDFAALEAENAEICAWIYVPGTKINLPVYQSLTDDNYYLDHAADGSYSVSGEIFSQSVNSRDFSDPVTLLYGHNMKNDGMFAPLHYFENTEFFNANDQILIYTPGHILTYEIVSAYQYDNRHIMNSFNFKDATVLRSYFDYVMAPESLVRNVREGVQLADDDKIVQLSTCTNDGNHDRRYLVTGVLIDDRLTK